MNVLLDECLPRKLKQFLPGYTVMTVPEMGWAGTGNGRLLSQAAAVFDAFVTMDGNLSYQQNIGTFDLGLVVLSAPSNRIEALLPLVPGILAALQQNAPGAMFRVSAPEDEEPK